MPDPYIQAKMNGQSPAFRDLAYIVFEDLPLADFEDVIPNLSFEVTRKANVPSAYTGRHGEIDCYDTGFWGVCL